MLDEAIDNIPYSTRKRKLFDSKSILAESATVPSVSINDSCVAEVEVRIFSRENVKILIILKSQYLSYN
jgi:hypothetical protein